MRSFCFIMVCCLLFAGIKAQTVVQKTTSSKPVFRSIVGAGILEGQWNNTTAQLQLVNGLQKNTWFAGLGLGVDYYGGKRSLPLFLDLKKYLFSNGKTPFVYADGGYNFSWLRNDQKANPFQGNNFKQKGGLFYDIGLGYKFPFSNKISLGFSGGYSFKQQSEEYLSGACTGCFPVIPASPESFDYKFRRLSIKMNCWF